MPLPPCEGSFLPGFSKTEIGLCGRWEEEDIPGDSIGETNAEEMGEVNTGFLVGRGPFFDGPFSGLCR
jgi:hypothetical protein